MRAMPPDPWAVVPTGMVSVTTGTGFTVSVKLLEVVEPAGPVSESEYTPASLSCTLPSESVGPVCPLTGLPLLSH